jgi:hypothetical protein
MHPAIQYGPEHEEHLGFGLYRYLDGGDYPEYNWHGPGWPDAVVEWITWGCATVILLMTAWMIYRRVRGMRFLPGLALPIAAVAFTIGIMHAIADDGDGDISALRAVYTMPAFTLYCCWLPLRSRSKRALWWPLDLMVLALTALSSYAQNLQFDLRAPIWFLPWFCVWLVVRFAIRGGRLATPAGRQAWRFLILAHAVALSIPAIGLLTHSVYYEEFVWVIALLGLPALALGMCVFLLAVFQMGKERTQLA